MIQWLDLQHFLQLQKEFEKNASPLQEFVSIGLYFKELDSIINQTPYYAEDKEVGKTVTWFGYLKNQPFYLMSFHDSPYAKSILGASSFEILADLEELGASFFKNITWINHYPIEARFSVFTFDRQDIKTEVYRSDSKEEADTTAHFLNQRGQTDSFYVDIAENLDSKWLVIEQRDEEEFEIARYADRISAEYFLRDYKKNNSNPLRLIQD